MQFVDTHCHIHFPDYELDPVEVIENAKADGVEKLLCVGCTLPDSALAVEFAKRYDNIWATVGLHPHEGAKYVHDHEALAQFRSLVSKPKVVAIGETGLDYHYMHSPKEDQEKLLRFQMDIAVEHNLPLIFHIRDAFDDFWKIFDQYKDIQGVVHSFSANREELDQILERNLYIGVNGIVTFTKFANQLEAVRAIPLEKLLLETDAPYLTPVPFRGKIGEPKYTRVTAEFLSHLRGETLEELATATSQNAAKLFNLKLSI